MDALHWCLLGPDLLRPAPERPRFPDPSPPFPPHTPLEIRRLGRRFEARWQAYFSTHPDWTLLAADPQIRGQQGRTLGAPDFLVQRGEEVWHVEIAVKFYLCRPEASGAEMAHWIGPSGPDRLDRKVERLVTHQLPLLDRPESHAWLNARGLPTPTHRGVVLKGILFSPWRRPATRQPWMAEGQPRGRWCVLPELRDVIPRASVLSRSHWLGAAPEGPLEGRALISAVEEQLQERGPTQLWDGAHRWFVMMPGWSAS